MRRIALVRPARCGVVLAALAVVACGLAPGERFGRAGARTDRLRLHIVDDVAELDPARATTPVERALARQLFAALVEPAGGEPRPSLATSWEVVGDRLRLHLEKDARFSDNTHLGAPEVVWSWRRALRPSTGTADPTPLSVIKNGADLARGALLRVAHGGAHGRPAPYSVFTEGPGAVVSDAELPAGTAVRVFDTNERTPCCGVAVPLHSTADLDAPAVGALLAGETAVVAGMRELPRHGRQPAVTLVQLRAAGGATGWARASDVAVHIPAVGLVHVVDRGGVSPTLRVGPDEDAPARALLADDDVVEVVERGNDRFADAAAPTCLAIDVKTGISGWLSSANLDDTVRERRWYFVERVDDPGARAWLPEQDLAFDPGLLDAHAVDDETVEIGLAAPLDEALLAFAEPVMRPVPPRSVDELGRAWTVPEAMPTSGPFRLVLHEPERIELARSSTSFERKRAGVERVELIRVKRPTTALHLYRAGAVDALLDGALPPGLAPTLSRASDFVPGPKGGALVAPEVKGLVPTALELRDVTVDVDVDGSPGGAR